MENKPEPDKIYSIDRNIANSSKDHIPGWGIDADPENDPTYPMKNWNGADHDRLNYEKAPQQPVDREILLSIERPGLTRVFGTSTPPSGISGQVRRFAFRFSEAHAAHWMSLLLADRINVVEGYIEDVKSGHMPDIFKAGRLRGEWKYNRSGFIRKAAIATAVTAGVIIMLNARKKRRLAKVS